MIDTDQIPITIITGVNKQALQINTEAREGLNTLAEVKVSESSLKARIVAQEELYRPIFKAQKVYLGKVVHRIKVGVEKTRRVSQYIIKGMKVAGVITGRIIIAYGQIIKDAGKKAKIDVEKIINETEKEVKAPPADELLLQQREFGEFYLGNVKLEVVSPIDYSGLIRFKECLCQVPNLTVVSVGGSAAGMKINIAVETPISIVDLLEGMAMVERVANGSHSICVTLRRN